MATSTLLTADEFFRHPAAREASELVEGEIVMMTPAGGRHNIVAGRIFTRLSAFVESHGLGMVFTDNLGFYLPLPGAIRDTVRAPDASYVRHDRLPDGLVPIGFLRCAPDLAVEVHSPDDRPGEIAARMRDYFAAGTVQVWEVDPDTRTVTVHASDRSAVVIDDAGSVDGGPTLPGFVLPVAPLFVGLATR